MGTARSGHERQPELVVLCDDAGRAIGTAPKATVHTADTPLHRAFSCYLFDDRARLLVTRRAGTKPTFPGLWTNSVCGHPAPGEHDLDAIVRRAQDELELDVDDLVCALPDFRYRASQGGIVENEVCPVYVGRTRGEPRPDATEADAWTWLTWRQLHDRLAAEPSAWSPWCREQVPQLDEAVQRFVHR